MRTPITLAGWLWIASMAALGSWIAAMAADTRPATEYLSGPVLMPDPVEDGGRVIVKLPIKRTRACPGTVHRLLRDVATGKIIAVYDPVPAVFPPSYGEGEIAKTFELPEGLPRRVQYEAETCFTCNPLQHFRPICSKVPPIIFGVIPRRG